MNRKLNKALNQLQKAKAKYSLPHKVIAKNLYTTGNAYRDVNNYPKALKYYEASIKMLNSIYNGHPHLHTAKKLNELGNFYYHKLENFQEALKYFKEGLRMRLQIDTTPIQDLVNSFNNIAVSYYQLKNYKEAIYYEKKSLELKKTIPDIQTADIANSLLAIGCSYQKLEKYQESLSYIIKALNLFQEIVTSWETNEIFVVSEGDPTYQIVNAPEAFILTLLSFILTNYIALNCLEEGVKFFHDKYELMNQSLSSHSPQNMMEKEGLVLLTAMYKTVFLEAVERFKTQKEQKQGQEKQQETFAKIREQHKIAAEKVLKKLEEEQTKAKEAQHAKEHKGWCNILYLNKIEYDNTILNHPDILKYVSQAVGGVSNAIDVSSRIDDEILLSGDSEFIDAAILSLN